ncbi:DUF3667 domain-containing protein [Chryseobacterium gotjawalense]|uniref:DUF3667 domain-containing protein n=1 Tax=Chryseobacterium gotjawalense TaxID=3042315 RepID=A0ABY8RFJ8_9FLAO|nr:DUF3667 domain-containing protein [Chryseobacterium sp. wdc7]WHF52745.1 DUF3667 domain-containing protein [Chryseobacterium sp. wdc7]
MIGLENRCKNCSQHLLLNQKYCHACGQKSDTHRINFHFLLHEVQHGILHVHSGIVFTIKELFTRPGHMLREYLDGRRKQHFPPLLFVLVMGSVCALIQFFLKHKTEAKSDHTLTTNLSKTEIANYIDFKGLIAYFEHIFEWLGGHLAFTILLMLPIAALAFFLGFRKYRYNYPEWLVILLFLAGQCLTFYVPFIFLSHFAGNFNFLFFVLCWAFVTFSLIQLFNSRGKWYVFLRACWSLFLSYLFSVIYIIFAILLITAVGILLYGYDNIIPKIMNKL